MQSTGQTSMQERSFVPMHGSAITRHRLALPSGAGSTVRLPHDISTKVEVKAWPLLPAWNDSPSRGRLVAESEHALVRHTSIDSQSQRLQIFNTRRTEIARAIRSSSPGSFRSARGTAPSAAPADPGRRALS
jgi:hypothetical protein